MIKTRRMRWAGHVAVEGEKCMQGFDGKSDERSNLENLGLDGRILLKTI